MTEPNREPALPFFIAGIGASAGGLEALVEFFRVAQRHTGIAYVVVQHLSPDFKSMMVELLARHTPLHVTEIAHGQKPEPDTVYLLPPKLVLTLEGGVFKLDERDPTRFSLPINIFLNSLALEQGEHCAAVILSGTGTDGTHGARFLKESGGLVLAQEPGTAKFDGMPSSVISNNLADRTGGPAELCQTLAAYALHPILRGLDETNQDQTEQESVGTIVRMLRVRSKIDFGLYKRGTITRRVQRRVSLLGLVSIEAYLRLLEESTHELDILTREMLIGVTQFFRDPEIWTYLEGTLLPQILDSAAEHSTLRIWCTGCSTGEEAYSLAMLFQEVLRSSKRQVSYRMFATDARPDSLAFARNGVYPQAACELIPLPLRERYFELQGDHYVARRSLRDSITFAQHDVLADPPFTQLDLITCRNMLIYFSHEAQQRAMARFRIALKEGSFLLLGASESVGESISTFQALAKRYNVYTARGTPPPTTALMVTPTRLGRADDGPGPRVQSRATELLYQAVIQRQSPPGVAIDTSMDLIQSFGDVSQFLRIPVGRISVNLLKMVPQAVAVLLNSAVRKAIAQEQEVEVADVRLNVEKADRPYTARIVPLLNVQGLPSCLLVFFEEQTRSADSVGAKGLDIDAAVQQRLRQLEDELTVARENLHSAVQDLEATNEELQATNEELTVSNEELQSTNEELQSVNEELYTVNTEYQQKIGELEELNTDLENLLRVMAAGVVFLDESLSIRRFNESATQLLPMRREDLGRPLSELAFRGAYPELVEDAKNVLKTGDRASRRVLGYDGTWWSVGMRLFQASATDPCGVIVTMQEISELTRTSSELSQLERAHEMAEDIASSGHAILDLTNEQVRYSAGARRLLGVSNEDVSLDQALSLFAPEARESLKQGMHLIKSGLDVPFVVDRDLVRRDGESIRVRISVQSRTDPVTEARLLFAVFQLRP